MLVHSRPPHTPRFLHVLAPHIELPFALVTIVAKQDAVSASDGFRATDSLPTEQRPQPRAEFGLVWGTYHSVKR